MTVPGGPLFSHSLRRHVDEGSAAVHRFTALVQRAPVLRVEVAHVPHFTTRGCVCRSLD